MFVCYISLCKEVNI